MARVVCRNVCKLYGESLAVDHVNLEVGEGEFLVIVGPSGCGKTTTLRMVAGLESISSGEILIDEQVVNAVEPRHRDIAMVFQNYALYPHKKVFDNIAYPLQLRNVPRNEIAQRVRETARMLGIEHLLERRPRQLSGGERQRVALGRAIVRRARLFLMDEPLSNLDAQLRIQMRREIIHLQRQLNITTIYVTHDQEEAMTMGHRIVVMRDGVVQQVGEPVTIYNHPANRFVARFIGSPPMNLFDGVLEHADGSLQLRTSFATYSLPPRLSDGLLRNAAASGATAVVCGIRAEDIAVGGEGAVQSGAPTGLVDLVEPLGSDVFVSAMLGTDLMLARAHPDLQIKEGQRTPVALNLNKLHLFAADNGDNLLVHR
ncbi:MAG TPA: ABC transporter ATP-binding protein [Caldilineaceae bacterium]|nr:ABC transporter ATP-binding protein [Caldilineaceae bacterium]